MNILPSSHPYEARRTQSRGQVSFERLRSAKLFVRLVLCVFLRRSAFLAAFLCAKGSWCSSDSILRSIGPYAFSRIGCHDRCHCPTNVRAFFVACDHGMLYVLVFCFRRLLVDVIFQLATSADTESEVRSEAYWVVLNAASCGSDAQVSGFLDPVTLILPMSAVNIA